MAEATAFQGATILALAVVMGTSGAMAGTKAMMGTGNNNKQQQQEDDNIGRFQQERAGNGGYYPQRDGQQRRRPNQ